MLTTRQLVSKHRWILSGGAVPPLMSELVLTLGDGEPGTVLDARQQEELPPAEVPLFGAQREVGTAQLLWDSCGGHAQPPEKDHWRSVIWERLTLQQTSESVASL